MATTINASGIYAIINIATGVCYVGSTNNLRIRTTRHLYDLRHGKHPNTRLQRSYNKHGDSYFIVEILELCSTDLLIIREQYWIDEKLKTGEIYNQAKVAGNQLGVKRSEETKARMSAAQKGRKASAETKAKQRLAKLGTSFRKGKKASEETRRRISEAKKGTIVSEETRRVLSQAKIGNKNSLGYKQSEETKRKRVASRMANKASRESVVAS